jgi:hypothetical protein
MRLHSAHVHAHAAAVAACLTIASCGGPGLPCRGEHDPWEYDTVEGRRAYTAPDTEIPEETGGETGSETDGATGEETTGDLTGDDTGTTTGDATDAPTTDTTDTDAT